MENEVSDRNHASVHMSKRIHLFEEIYFTLEHGLYLELSRSENTEQVFLRPILGLEL